MLLNKFSKTMKQLFYTLLICLLFTVNVSYAQDGGQIQIDEKTIIKNEKGEIISLTSFMKMMPTGDWSITQKKDKDGKMYIQLKKSNAEEKAMMLKMMSGSKGEESRVGKKAPDFQFTDINGNIISSENTKGKIVVLNFWFTTCKPCINEIPELNEVYAKYKDNKDIVFASISFEKQDKVERFLKKKPINYPVVANSKVEIGKFAFNGYPTNVVIGKDGKYAEFITGGFPGIGEHIDTSITEALK